MMENLEVKANDELNIESFSDNEKSPDGLELPSDVNCCSIETLNNDSESTSTSMIEYREIEEPCVALTIIGENRLSNAGVFIMRGTKFSFKAFFSTLVLTIMNMFI